MRTTGLSSLSNSSDKIKESERTRKVGPLGLQKVCVRLRLGKEAASGASKRGLTDSLFSKPQPQADMALLLGDVWRLRNAMALVHKEGHMIGLRTIHQKKIISSSIPGAIVIFTSDLCVNSKRLCFHGQFPEVCLSCHTLTENITLSNLFRKGEAISNTLMSAGESKTSVYKTKTLQYQITEISGVFTGRKHTDQ